MADKKYDWSETDRVMDELRRQLAAERELIEGITAPGIADVIAEAHAAEADQAPVEADAPDDPATVLSMHGEDDGDGDTADLPDADDGDGDTADLPDADDGDGDAADLPDADDGDGDAADLPDADDGGAEDHVEAPLADTPDETSVAEGTFADALAEVSDPEMPAEVSDPEMPAEEPAPEVLAEEALAEEALAEEASAEKRRKRKRVPRLAEIEAQTTEAPLFAEARESTKRRAAAFAEQEDSDLFWRRTPKGRVSRRKAEEGTPKVGELSPAEAPAAEPAEAPVPTAAGAPAEHTPTEVAEAKAPAVPEITQMEIPLDLPAAEAETDAVPHKRRTKRATMPVAEVEQLTVESLLSDIFGGDVSWSEPTATEEQSEAVSEPLAEDAAPAVAQVTRVRNGDGPILEIDGRPVDLPDERESAREEALPAEEAPAAAAEEPTAPTEDAVPAEDDNAPERERVKLFSAFSVRRNKEGALPKPTLTRMSAEQAAFKRKLESSEEDFKLLVDLDYEDELGDAIGFEKIREYHERVVNGKTKEKTGSRTRDKGEYEYTSHSLDIRISNFYAKQRRRHIINLAVSVVMMIVLFILERSQAVRALFGAPYAGFAYAPAYIVTGLVFFGVTVVLMQRSLRDGIVRLCRLTPSDYSLASVTVIVTLLYHAMLFFAPADSSMTLFLSPAVASLALVALSDLFNWHRESCAFRVVSSKKQKYALMSRVSVGNREGDAKRRLFENEQRERVLYVRPVSFVRNYFANTRKKADHHSSFGAEILLVAAVSVALALFTAVFGNNFGYALHTAFVTFLITAPVLTVLATSMPMVMATWLRLKRTGAIVGESAVYECGGRTALVLPDSACFKPMPHEQFELVKNCDAERATVLIRALLERIGSQLVYSVEVPEEYRLSADAVTLTDIDAHGVAAVVTGERNKTPILLGDVAYLQRYGIRVAPKKDGRYEELCRNMLCVAIGNRLTALFITRYRPEEEMQELLDATDAEGISLVIRTKDPGLHDSLLETLFDGVELPVRTVKPLPAESDIRTDYVDATVVAIGSSLEAARTFTVCRRIRRVIRLGKFWQLAAIFLGTVLAGTLTFFGNLVALPAYLVVTYNVFWCGVHALSAFLHLRRERDEQ